MGTVPTQPSQLTPSTTPQPTQQPPAVIAPKPAKDPSEQSSVGTSQKDLVRAALQQHVQAKAVVNPSASQYPPDKKEQVPQQAKAAPVPIAPLPSLPMASLINSSPSLLQQAMTAQASASTQQTAANMAQFMLLAQQAMKTSQLMQAMQQQSVSRSSAGLKPPPAAPTATQDSSGGDTKQ